MTCTNETTEKIAAKRLANFSTFNFKRLREGDSKVFTDSSCCVQGVVVDRLRTTLDLGLLSRFSNRDYGI